MNDMNQLLMIVVYVFIAAMAFAFFSPVIQFLIDFFGGKKKSFIEQADDAHVALYRKRKKASVENVKDTRLKYLVFLGDEDYYDNARFGRIRGAYWKNEIVELFVQTRKLRPWLWIKIPRELVRDALGRNLRVEGNGVEPLGNFFKIIPTKSVRNKLVEVLLPNPGKVSMTMSEYYDHLVLGHEALLLTHEKAIEAEEQKVHAMIDAVDTKRKADVMIKRPDYAPQVPGTPEEGTQYDQE